MEISPRQKKYLTNRVDVIKKVKERHRINLDDPIYKELKKAYYQIYNTKESILVYESKLKKLRRKLEYWIERKQVLRIEWRKSKKAILKS